MWKKIFLYALFSFLGNTLAHAVPACQANIVGNLRDVTSTTQGTGTAFIRTRLRNYSGFVPRVIGTGVLAVATQDIQTDSAGNVNAFVYSNDCITPTNTYYRLEFWSGGKMTSAVDIVTTTASTVSLGSPLPVPPAGGPPNPTDSNPFVLKNPNADQTISGPFDLILGGNFLPQLNGSQNLGSTTRRWNAFLFNLDVQQPVSAMTLVSDTQLPTIQSVGKVLITALPTFGSGSKLVTTNLVSFPSSGDCVKWGTTGDLIDAGPTCITDSGNFVPHPRIHRWAYNVANGAALSMSSLGDVMATAACSNPGSLQFAAPTSTAPVGNTAPTTLNANSCAGLIGNPIYLSGFKNLHSWTFLSLSTTSNVRYWVGFTGISAQTQAQSDSPTGDYVGFRFSTAAGDTHWQCVTNNNSVSANVVDSGASATLAPIKLEIQETTAGAKYNFFINNIPVCGNITAQLPRNTQALSQFATVNTTNSSAISFTGYWFYAETDF